MSNTSSSHGSSRGIDFRPSTPDQTRPTLSRSNSLAPKSEYLRHALQARRAQGTPTPSPQDIKVPPPLAQKPPEICTPKTSPDIFDQFALTEEQMTPVSPIRRRRPSDARPPQSRTSRELTEEIDKLKQTLMTANMRVELLRKDNKVLQHDLTAAKEQIERMEPLEDANYELTAENKQLRLKMEKMDEEMTKLREIDEEHRKTNIELTAIASESAAHWTDHELAIEEAAEHIIKMEEEKELLSEELRQLKQRVMAIESHSPASTLVNSPGKFPLRVFSVDESRPSTSHFDSDYYSQPESPQAKHSSASIRSFTPSERSKKFLDLKEERRRSARDLSERMSAVSLKALRDASLSPTPEEVPAVPTTHQQQVPSIVADDRSATPSRRREHVRQIDQPRPLSLMDAAEISPPRAHTVAPQAPDRQPDGLRGLYRPRKPSSRASTDQRPSSSYIPSTTNTPGSSLGRHHSTREASPHVPARSSSRHRTTERSTESPQRTSPRHRSSSIDARTPQTNRHSMAPGWESTTPPPSYTPYSPASNTSTLDLTSSLDPRRAKDQWWRSLDRLTHSQVMAQEIQAQGIQMPRGYDAGPNPTPAVVAPPNSQRTRSSSTTGQHRSRRPTPTPSSALNSHPVVAAEKDCLFNAEESTEDFMSKMRGGKGSRDSVFSLR
ncbi:hypothetical protein J4E83_004261 [Alternaria metachromatica]|uniref:uncharacterized protein n=1 Tax=Alternaria metachromatica TaxID=283354 RepID=UPI0020C36D32|nr:uncharacterized protein J4E83_004261 [Alternaria metachromatica]KAI4624585.1 hypothetical protein J4E83_004261 [Alternaria metachromatica]